MSEPLSNMHLGVTPWNFTDLSAASLSAQAVLAEQLGCESFWLPENHFNPGAVPDPLMLLAAVAAQTKTIRLATTSYLLTLRNPLQAAEQVAVLDQLSNGRVILGVGRGYAADMLKAFKVVPKNKRRIFADTLEIMQQAWAGEPVPIGESNDADAPVPTVVLDPLPVQRPHPPIWVAAFGPKALAQAGRLGMPYLASPMETLESLRQNMVAFTQAANEAQQSLPPEVPLMRSVYVSSNAADIARVREDLNNLERRNPLGTDESSLTSEQWSIVGDKAYVADKIAEYQEVLGMTHLVATRLRLPGFEQSRLEASLKRLAEILN